MSVEPLSTATLLQRTMRDCSDSSLQHTTYYYRLLRPTAASQFRCACTAHLLYIRRGRTSSPFQQDGFGKSPLSPGEYREPVKEGSDTIVVVIGYLWQIAVVHECQQSNVGTYTTSQDPRSTDRDPNTRTPLIGDSYVRYCTPETETDSTHSFRRRPAKLRWQRRTLSRIYIILANRKRRQSQQVIGMHILFPLFLLSLLHIL